MKKYNVAVVGATGMVGRKFLEVLSEKNLPVENYYLFASAKSAGKTIDFMGKPHEIIELAEKNLEGKNIDPEKLKDQPPELRSNFKERRRQNKAKIEKRRSERKAKRSNNDE